MLRVARCARSSGRFSNRAKLIAKFQRVDREIGNPSSGENLVMTSSNECPSPLGEGVSMSPVIEVTLASKLG